jgi:HSP20 family molecular chaperone IbpA
MKAAPRHKPLSFPAKPVMERLEISSPMVFFSTLNWIEDLIAKESLALFAGRSWQGKLNPADWQEAEDRLLEHPSTRWSTNDQVLSMSMYIPHYAARDLVVHQEGSLLCVCAVRHGLSNQDKSRMFRTKTKIPAPFREAQIEAWLENGFLHVNLIDPSVGKTARVIRPLSKHMPKHSETTAA